MVNISPQKAFVSLLSLLMVRGYWLDQSASKIVISSYLGMTLKIKAKMAKIVIEKASFIDHNLKLRIMIVISFSGLFNFSSKFQ